jgi:hypothetical protein
MPGVCDQRMTVRHAAQGIAGAEGGGSEILASPNFSAIRSGVIRAPL